MPFRVGFCEVFVDGFHREHPLQHQTTILMLYKYAAERTQTAIDKFHPRQDSQDGA
jgi:hypothetical protein